MLFNLHSLPREYKRGNWLCVSEQTSGSKHYSKLMANTEDASGMLKGLTAEARRRTETRALSSAAEAY